MGSNNKTVHLQIRVSPEQKAMIMRASELANLPMSAWILNKVLPSKKKKFHKLVKALQVDEDRAYVFAELNDLLSNISSALFTDTVADRPNEQLRAYTENYLAAMVEHAAAQKEVACPAWTRDIPPLTQPVFGTDLKSLRLHLLTHSPSAFRSRNIFIDATLGDRV